MLDELDWPSLEARRDQSSLLLFHKIHCGAVSLETDKYMTPAHSLKTTRSSHSAQYRRHLHLHGLALVTLLNTDKFPLPVTITNTASFLKQFVSGIPFQP